MPKVICTLPNASSEINGIKFVKHKLGMVSEEIDPQVAKDLASIHGYHLHDPETGGPVISESSSTSKPPQPQPTGGESGAGSTAATPEGLADAAKDFSNPDRQKLIKLLMAQQQPPKSAPKPSGRSSSGGAATNASTSSPPPAASTAQSADTDGSGAPSSSSIGESSAKTGDPLNPEF